LQEALTKHYSKEQLTQLGIIIPSMDANIENRQTNQMQANENASNQDNLESNRTMFNTMPRQKHVNNNSTNANGGGGGLNNSAFFYSPSSLASSANSTSNDRNANALNQYNNMLISNNIFYNNNNNNSSNLNNTPNTSFSFYDSNNSRSKYHNMRDYRYGIFCCFAFDTV
jgi:hypothetical protein